MFEIANALEDLARATAGKPLENIEQPPEPVITEEQRERRKADILFNSWVNEQDLDLRDEMFVRAARQAYVAGEADLDEESPEDVLDEFGVPEVAR